MMPSTGKRGMTRTAKRRRRRLRMGEARFRRMHPLSKKTTKRMKAVARMRIAHLEAQLARGARTVKDTETGKPVGVRKLLAKLAAFVGIGQVATT